MNPFSVLPKVIVLVKNPPFSVLYDCCLFGVQGRVASLLGLWSLGWETRACWEQACS